MRRGFMSNRAAERMRIIEHWALAGAAAVAGGAAMLLLIDRLELEFRPGLNVLTGETGAGKSILLDCLGFVLGWRGRADLVRAGVVSREGGQLIVT